MFSAFSCDCTRYLLRLNGKRILKNFSSRMNPINYYDALGIPRSSTQNDIKTAYYKLSMQFHPDKNHGCENSAKKFREISQAYEVLGNYHLRRLYDKGVIHTAGQEFANPAASQSATASVVEEDDDPATKFYKSRMKRTHVADASGRTPIYNFDEWSRAHYGQSFQRKKDAKARYDEREKKEKRDSASEAHEILLFGMVFAGVVIYATFYSQSSYDMPKAMSKHNNIDGRKDDTATND